MGLTAVSAHACWDYRGYIKGAHREASHGGNQSQNAGLSSELQKKHQRNGYRHEYLTKPEVKARPGPEPVCEDTEGRITENVFVGG